MDIYKARTIFMSQKILFYKAGKLFVLEKKLLFYVMTREYFQRQFYIKINKP